jgi:prolyl-tRNA editing enzyme YbaK/EbsC (Cys-tRNA(Pro) deacylase)
MVPAMPAQEQVIRDLDALEIAYEEMSCDPALADTAQFCEAYGIPPEQSANAILVASRRPIGHQALCLVLATDRLDVNGTVRQRLGVRKVSFASPELTLEMTGQEIGGVTVFGVPDDLPIWIDGAVLDQPWVIVGAGTRSAKIKLNPAVFAESDRFEIVDGLSMAPTPTPDEDQSE